MAKKVQKEVATETVATAKNHILTPVITEKASHVSVANAYTFNVGVNATKLTIAKEVKTRWNVSPVKVNILNNKPKNVFVRGRWGKTSGSKKAIVFLKKGDSISFTN